MWKGILGEYLFPNVNIFRNTRKRGVSVNITVTEISKWYESNMIEQLIGALDSPDEEVRKAAAQALGKAGEPRAVEPLIAILEDDRLYPRLEASKALGKIGLPAVDLLIKGLGKISFNNEIVPPEKAFWEKKFYVHDMAARTLVRVGKVAVPSLIEIIEGNDEVLCQHAADALARIKDKRAVDPLIKALNQYSSEITTWKIIRSLGEIGDRKCVEFLFPYLINNRIPFIRWETADSLGKLKSIHALKYLFKALEDPHEEVRRTSARALGKIGDRSAVGILIQILEQEKGGKPREDVRWEAIRALGRIGGPNAQEALVKALHDDREDIRLEAEKALKLLS
ncbi:hypothetical protein BK729_16330 [Bacillus thuringiensis serovar wratislaviensis]|nr:hypothetical protein BK729_16330 [Bacillus thuringiensis serovar wratislaviensis]OUB62079.1 hypothetical protein BK743_06970 [Bacillus thuringiensis serovar sylvestriensis]